MITAYAIGVAAKLEDGVTPALLKIIDTLKTTNALMLNFVESVRLASKASDSFAVNMNRAAAASVKMGESSSGLTRASYILDTMAVSSGVVARNMVAASGGIVVGGGRGGGSNYGSAGSAAGRAAGYASAGVLVGGIVGNARIQDENIKSVATSQLDVGKWASGADDLRTREMAYAAKYGWATHGDIMPFGEAMLEGARLLRTLSPEKQIQMMNDAMPYIALEAKLKGVSLPESTNAFIGLAHMAGAYNPGEASKLYEAMLQTSLTTHLSLPAIQRAASYALPSIHAAGGNPSDVMLLLATMMQGGILNTKSGTWLNSLALNAMPNTLGSGLFKNKAQNDALQMLGLYSGNHSNFYKNGNMDLMKIVSLLADARLHMDPQKFGILTGQAFGKQGQRLAGFISQGASHENLLALSALKDSAIAPFDLSEAIKQASVISSADQTIANAKITVMNATNMLQSTVGGGVNMLQSASEWGTTHPLTGTAALVGGVFGTVVLGKLALAAVTSVSTALIAGLTSTAFVGALIGAIVPAMVIAMGVAVLGALSKGDLNGMTDPKGHPGMIFRHVGRGSAWVSISPIEVPNGHLNTAHLGEHFMRAGRGGGWVPDINVNVLVDKHKIATALVPAHNHGSSTFNPAAIRQGFAQ